MSLIAAPFAILAILYAGGFLAQLLGNYATWKQGGGIPGDGTSPLAASPDFLLCLSSVLRPPYGVYGILICIGLLAVLLIMVMRMGYGLSLIHIWLQNAGSSRLAQSYRQCR